MIYVCVQGTAENNLADAGITLFKTHFGLCVLSWKQVIDDMVGDSDSIFLAEKL